MSELQDVGGLGSLPSTFVQGTLPNESCCGCHPFHNTSPLGQPSTGDLQLGTGCSCPSTATSEQRPLKSDLVDCSRRHPLKALLSCPESQVKTISLTSWVQTFPNPAAKLDTSPTESQHGSCCSGEWSPEQKTLRLWAGKPGGLPLLGENWFPRYESCLGNTGVSYFTKATKKHEFI